LRLRHPRRVAAALAAHDTTGEADKLRKAIADTAAKISRYRGTLEAVRLPTEMKSIVS
jgi:hypothetical protein